MGDQELRISLVQYSGQTVRSLVFLDVSHEVYFPHAKVEVGDLGLVIGVDPAEERSLKVAFPQAPAWFFLKPEEVELFSGPYVLSLSEARRGTTPLIKALK